MHLCSVASMHTRERDTQLRYTHTRRHTNLPSIQYTKRLFVRGQKTSIVSLWSPLFGQTTYHRPRICTYVCTLSQAEGRGHARARSQTARKKIHTRARPITFVVPDLNFAISIYFTEKLLLLLLLLASTDCFVTRTSHSHACYRNIARRTPRNSRSPSLNDSASADSCACILQVSRSGPSPTN